MTAERLREAAKVLRDTRLLPPDPHDAHENCADCKWDRFALAVADWLDHGANVWAEGTVFDDEAVAAGCDCPYCKGLPLALAVADAVLGGESR